MCPSLHTYTSYSLETVSQSAQPTFLVGVYVFSVSFVRVAFLLLFAAKIAAVLQHLNAGYLLIAICVTHAGKIKFYLSTCYLGTRTIPKGSTNHSRVTKWKGVVHFTCTSFLSHLAGQKNLSCSCCRCLYMPLLSLQD